MSNNGQSIEKKKEKHRLDFFRPDQITFLVTHETMVDDRIEDGRLTDNLLKEWSDQLDDYLKRQPKKQQWMLSQRQPLRGYSFPAIGVDVPEELPDEYQTKLFDGASFSIIVCNVERVPTPNTSSSEGDNDPENAREENKKYPEKKNEERVQAKKSLLSFISTLNDDRKSLSFAGLTVQGVLPNWIISGGSSDSGGTGGPGGPPSPYNGTEGYNDTADPAPAPFFFQDLISKLKGGNPSGKYLYGDGTDVDVIILDTAPPAADLVLAHKELVLLKDGDKKHRLIEHLLGPNGKLKLYPATYEEQLRMGNTSLNSQGYKMADHGLFIAGIVHSIVPEATIHLIEVLNQFGVGDIETIASGLDKAYAICRQTNGRAVINGSWCLDLPDLLERFAYQPTEEEEIAVEDKQMEAQLRQHLQDEMDRLVNETGKDRKQLQDDLDWVLGLRAMCERLGEFGRQVVAAAGNQGRDAGRLRDAPDARYPAAFTKVVGVGALPKNAERNDGSGKYDASSFSNLADKPEIWGIMALGGEPGEENGLLGIYLGEFPPETDPVLVEYGWDRTGPKCVNGWAWWAGTSFATPVITGLIASVLSGPEKPATTQRAVQILYDECIILEAITEKNEDGVPSSLVQTFPPDDWPA